MAKRKEKFPKHVFVVFEENNGDEWLNISETPEPLAASNDVREIAVYALVRVAKLKNTTEVV